MTETTSRFVGTIPENYDRGLGPNLFHAWADDLARRVGETGAARALELAGGTGILSRRLRDALGPEADLVVTDLNPPMLEVARAKFRDGERVAFQPADAMALPFAEAAFDLVACQFGVMFFPDKPAAFREAARVLAPGGHFLFNSWGAMAENPFSEVAHEVTARFFPDDPPGFYQVPFSYPDPAAVRADLAAAGWHEVAHETIDLQRTVTDLAGFARGLVHGNPLADEIRARGGVDPEEVMAATAAALAARFGPEPMTMPLRATVFTCRDG